MSIFDPVYIDHETDTKVKQLVLNRLDKDRFDALSTHSPDELWFIQESNLSGQPIVVDTRPVEIPTKLSEFQNDVPYLSTVSWYDITNRPTIPTYTSQLTNNSGYATSAYVQQQVLLSKTKWRDWHQEEPPIDYSDTPLTIVARTAGTTVGMVQDYDPTWGSPGAAPTISLQYSTDNGSTWNPFTVGSTTITLSQGGTVQFKATTTNAAMDTDNCLRFNRFDIVGLADVRGNPQSLLNGTDFISIAKLTNGQLGQIFRGQPVVDASKMVITAPTADSHSCSHMFRGSTTLKHGPDLRSTTLGSTYTYDGFFNGCTSLETIRIHYTGNFSPASVFDVWVNGVPASGTFYYNGTDTTRGTSAIPTGWTVQSF